MMANGHEKPRLMVSRRLRSWMKIIINPMIKNPMLSWVFVIGN